MSSHQMQSVEEYCQELLILKNGKTVLQGNLKAIKASYGRTNLSVSCDGNIEALITEQAMKVISRNATGYEFKINSDEQAYALLEKMLKANVRLDKFEIREPSLHEIFVEKVGE